MNRFDKNINLLITNLEDIRYYNLLVRVSNYIDGRISPKQLTKKLSKDELDVLVMVLNKVINYWKKDIHYYVELPNDIYFNTDFEKAIIACKHESVDLSSNYCVTCGPSYYSSKYPRFNDSYLTEIKGDFSRIPEGLMLSNSDWYKIIAKYPYLYERMYRLMDEERGIDISVAEKLKYGISEVLRCKINKKDTANDDIIDSIKFVSNKVYITVDRIRYGLGSFDSLLECDKDDIEVYNYKRVLRK